MKAKLIQLAERFRAWLLEPFGNWLADNLQKLANQNRNQDEQIASLLSAVQRLPSVEMYKAMELKQKQRHEELMGAIQALTQSLQQSHVTQRPPVFEYTDYESAMVAEMIKMQREPEKEH